MPNYSSIDYLVTKFRAEFPALNQDFIYLDSAATSLKPLCMITATSECYSSVGNVFRSQYSQAVTLTEQYENTRDLVRELINAKDATSIVWTKGATEAVNLIANSYLKNKLCAGDEIIVSVSEHHANLIPWIMLAKSVDAKIIPLPLNEDSLIDVTALKTLINSRTKLLAITQMSNITGAVSDLESILSMTKDTHCAIAVDGSQGIVHLGMDVQKYDVDFYFFSAHKLYGPNGIGVLYIHPDKLDELSPWQGGGKMLSHAKMDDFIAEDPPYHLEAGTPNVAGVIGFNATLAWLKQWDWVELERHAIHLSQLAHDKLQQIEGYQRISVDNSPLLSFIIKGIFVTDLALLLSEQNIAIRSGLNCAHPLNKALNVNGTVRASFAPFNTIEEVEIFVEAVKKSVDILR